MIYCYLCYIQLILLWGLTMNRHDFYQGKYEYYSSFHMWVIIAACISSVFYFFSDCYLFGYFTTATLIPRLAILIPFTIYLIMHAHIKDYRIMITAGYVVIHCIMWCTIWSCCYLEDLNFTCSGFIIINFIFLALGITASPAAAIISQGLLFVDITIANTFIDYPRFDMMLLLGIPMYLGICVFNIAIERTYRDQVIVKQQLEYNIEHDALTGTYNRNKTGSLADQQNVLINFKADNSGIIMYDIDFFKKVNDTYGHITGDHVLVDVSKNVQSLLNNDEYLIRWGGEEFIVLVKGSEDEIRQKAEKIRHSVEMLELPEVSHITISVGVAIYNGGDYQNTVKCADKALYFAKNNGRNRVVIYNNEMV